MFCTKCGANNEDNNVFCKKCGARLAKPVTNSADDTVIDNRSISNNSVSGSQSTTNSLGVAKSVNIKLIAGLAVGIVVLAGFIIIGKLSDKTEAETSLVNVVTNDDAMVDNTIPVAAQTESIMTDSIATEETIVEEVKEIYGITAEDLAWDIQSFAQFIANGMYSVSDKYYFDSKITLEDVMVMTSTKKVNAGIFSVYESNPSIIVSNEAQMENIDEFISLCGEAYRKIQHDIRKNKKSVTESFITVTVIDSNIDDEYKYYDGEAEKVYILAELSNHEIGTTYCMFEMIQSYGKPDVWLINDCWGISSNYRFSKKLLSADSLENISNPAWLEAYRDKFADGYDVALVGVDDKEVPYLVRANDALYHYNGTEIEMITTIQEIEYNPSNTEYNPNSNQLYSSTSVYEYYPDSSRINNLTKYNCYIDLYTGKILYEIIYEIQNEKNKHDRSYFDGEGSVITEEKGFEGYLKYNGMIPNPIPNDGELGVVYDMYIVEEGYIEPVKINFCSIDRAYLEYQSEYGYKPLADNTSDADIFVSPEINQGIDVSKSEYILEDSNSRYLTKSDLQGLSADECRIARNEIYARYGRKFNDEGLQSYFNSCSWYNGTIEPDDFQESMLNDYEIENKNLIVEYEKEMGYR